MSEFDFEEQNVADLPLWSDVDANIRLSLVCEKHKVPMDVLTGCGNTQRAQLRC